MAQKAEISSGTGDTQVVTGPATFMGYSIRESAGTAAAASLIIRDGTSTSGTAVAVVELVADAFDWQWLGPNGVQCANGIFLDRTAGETHVVIYYR